MTHAILALWTLLGCGSSAPSGHGHDHGGGAHPHDDAPDDTVAITRWTDGYELFVELDAPVAGQRFAYHAHVTRLADNHAATSGTLAISFEDDGFAMESHTDPQLARAGIFASHGPAPSEPGPYSLLFTYTDGDERVSWQGGTVVVGSSEPAAQDSQDEGEVTFLKEAQWQIPFEVQPASQLRMAPNLSAAAVVSPSPNSTTVSAAPADGLLAWSGELPVVGRRVSRGEPLATLLPAGAAGQFSSLQADLASARADHTLAAAELARVEDLAARDLLPQRRLDEARAGVQRADAELSGTRRRMSALTSGGAGAVPIRAPADGIIVHVGAAHGQGVSAGTALVAVSTGTDLLIEGHVHDRSHVDLSEVSGISVLRGDWAAPVSLDSARARLLTQRLIFDHSALSAPLAILVTEDVGLAIGDLVEVQLSVGEAEPRLAVPREAVVEINSQDVVFVQKTGESFTRRRVTVGRSDATHVEISTGLAEGEMVVVQGGFDVHVASLSGSLESHRH